MRNTSGNPFVSMNSSQDRLNSWRDLRASLEGLETQEALALVAEYWGQSPVSHFSYNPESPADWPSPWEMISHGDWCRRMIAVAMEMTLRIAGWDTSRLKIVAFRDYDISEELLVLKIDDQWALNYSIGEVVPYPETHQVVTAIWQFQGRNYKELPR